DPEVLRQRVRPALPPAAKPRRAEPGGVEAGHQVGAVREVAQGPEGAEAVLAPGGGDDLPLGLRAGGAEEDRGLVQLVHEPHRGEEEAAAEAERRREPVVEVGELDRDLAVLPGGGVLELDLRVEEEPVVELVAEVDDGPEVVELVPPAGGRAVLPLRAVVLV